MKKNVLLVFPGIFIKEDEGAKHRLFCHITEYKKAGYNVEVLAFCKDAFNRVDKKYLSADAVWMIRPMILPAAKCLLFTKILHFYIKLIVALHSWYKKYSIIQFELWSERSALCRKKGTTYITDVHGDLAFEFKENRNAAQWFVNFALEQQRAIIENSDIVIVVTENLKKQLEINTQRTIKRYAVISCGLDIEKFRNAKCPEKEVPNLDGRIVVGYCGAFQGWQNFDEMLNLVIRLRKLDSSIFFMVFSNSNPAPYKESFEKIGSDNYFIKGLPSVEVANYLQLLDAGLLLRSNLVLNKVSSPTKICEYLAAGVPIICTQYSGDYQRSVEVGRNGFVSKEPEFSDKEVNELYDWLKNVKSNRSKFREICFESVQNRTFEAEFKNLLNLIAETND